MGGPLEVKLPKLLGNKRQVDLNKTLTAIPHFYFTFYSSYVTPGTMPRRNHKGRPRYRNWDDGILFDDPEDFYYEDEEEEESEEEEEVKEEEEGNPKYKEDETVFYDDEELNEIIRNIKDILHEK